MEFLRLLGEYKGEIGGWLEKFFEEKLIKVEKVDEEVLGVVKGLKEIGMKGKRLRGFLVGVGYGVGNGWQRLEWRRVPDEVWKVGMGLELFHLGLLVQDDVMDRDEVRRGVKTIHARYDDLHYGEAMADLGADMCFGWAAELLAEGGSLAVVGEWGRYFERVARGQVLDLKIKKEKRKKKKEYEEVMRLKTGEYTGEMPLRLGCLLAGGKEELVENLGRWGLEWGVGFQIRDDLLDRDGLVEILGEEQARVRLEEQIKKAARVREEIFGEEGGGLGGLLAEMEEWLGR